jgi:hypothetical protein
MCVVYSGAVKSQAYSAGVRADVRKGKLGPSCAGEKIFRDELNELAYSVSDSESSQSPLSMSSVYPSINISRFHAASVSSPCERHVYN